MTCRVTVGSWRTSCGSRRSGRQTNNRIPTTRLITFIDRTRGIPDTAQWPEKHDIQTIRFSGFIAQEVEQAAQAIDYNFSGIDAPKNPDDFYGLRYAEFVVPLVKAVQDQHTLIRQLMTENADLKAAYAGMRADIAQLKASQRAESTIAFPSPKQ